MENQSNSENETATAYELPGNISSSSNSNGKDATSQEEEQKRGAALRADLDARWKAKMQSRSDDAQARLEQRKETDAPDENVDAFSTQFKLDKDALLASIQDASQQAQDGKLSRQQLEAKLTEAALQTQSLQEQVSGAAMFLPSYDLRQFSDVIVKLDACIGKAREKGAPRRKFTFSQRAKERTARKAAENKAAAEEASLERQEAAAQAPQEAVAGDKTTDSLGPSEIVIDASSELTQCEGPIVLSTSALQASQFVRFTGLRNRTIYICCTVGALRLVDLSSCTVVCGPINGPCFIENCNESTVVAVSRQMRIHDTTNTDLYLATLSRPIIEHCSGLRFAPYVVQWEGLVEQLHAVGLSKALKTDSWSDVDDFLWLRIQQSPNWSVLPEDQRITELSRREQKEGQNNIKLEDEARLEALGVRLLMAKLVVD